MDNRLYYQNVWLDINKKTKPSFYLMMRKPHFIDLALFQYVTGVPILLPEIFEEHLEYIRTLEILPFNQIDIVKL